MTKRLFGLALAALCIFGATPASAITIGYGIGSEAAAAAATTFTDAYTNVQTQDFESYGSIGESTPFPLDIGFGTISRPAGSTAGYIAYNTGDTQNAYGEVGLDKYYFSNGVAGSPSGKGTFTVNLDTNYRAMGFYATDWQDIGGHVTLDVIGDGWSDSIDVYGLLGALDTRELVYFSLFSELAFNTVIFNASGGDGYGIDNLSVGSPTPIPGAFWLLGSGLLGLVGLRRRIA